MDPDNGTSSPPLPPSCYQVSRPGCHSLPPASIPGPSHVLPLYPSSALHHYYPSTASPVLNSTHILTSPNTSPLHSRHVPLPSASQTHIPLLWQTPSTPFPQLQMNNQILNDNDLIAHANSLSPLAFARPFTPHVLCNNNTQSLFYNTNPPVIVAPQPVPLPANPTLSPVLRSPLRSLALTPVSSHSSSFPLHSKLTLPLTKDIFLYYPVNIIRDHGMLWSAPLYSIRTSLDILWTTLYLVLPMTQDFGRHTSYHAPGLYTVGTLSVL